jgi:alpha-1,6-mannosyltransferase
MPGAHNGRHHERFDGVNDLAEKALDTLGAVRRQVQHHAVLCLGAAGFVVGTVTVLAGGRAVAARADLPLTSWLGAEDTRNEPVGPLPGSLWVAAVAVLWVVLLGVARRRDLGPGRIWALAGAWALPFVAGPPIMDTVVYSDVAYGRLLRSGFDPYAVGPLRLGETPLVLAINPGDRSQPTSAGPLGTFAAHLALSISGGSDLLAVLVLRGMALLAVVWIGRSAIELGGRASGLALAACVANPLVLLYGLNSPHLDVATVACLLAALVFAGRRRWLAAVTLTAVGGSIAPVGLVAVPLVIVAHWSFRVGRRRGYALARDIAVAAAVITAAGFLQDHGFGWVTTARSQFSRHTPFSVVGATERLLSFMVRAASFDDLAAGARLTAALAAVCTIGYLLLTPRRRPLAAGFGYALLALGLLAPVLDPWYLLWGVLCLLPTASALQRVWAAGLSIGACVLVPLGFGTTAGNAVTALALAVVGLGTLAAAWSVRERPVAADEPEPAVDAEAADDDEPAPVAVAGPAPSAVSADG